MSLTQPRIKEKLSALGMTQHDLARAVGVHESYLNKVLNGRMMPKIEMALRIANALGCTVEELWSPDNAPAETTISRSGNDATEA